MYTMGYVTNQKHPIVDRPMVHLMVGDARVEYMLGNPEEFKQACENLDGSVIGTKSGMAALFWYVEGDQFANFVNMSIINSRQ